MRLSDEGATYTHTGGGWALSIIDNETYAASHGVAQAPVSPTWRTRPDNGLTSCPSALQPVTNIFSSMTETVCDLPDPCTPNTRAEKGVFVFRYSRVESLLDVVRGDSASGCRDSTMVPNTPYWLTACRILPTRYAPRVNKGAFFCSWTFWTSRPAISPTKLMSWLSS